MSNTKISPEDPRLTAYALGELEGEDRILVEAAVREDPALRATLEEIRAMAGELTSALAAEAAADVPLKKEPSLKDAAIVQGRDYRKLDGGPMAKVIKFPRFYYIVGGLAAACFALFVALNPVQVHENRTKAAQKKIYTEVTITGGRTMGNNVGVKPERAADAAEKQDSAEPEASALVAKESARRDVLADQEAKARAELNQKREEVVLLREEQDKLRMKDARMQDSASSTMLAQNFVSGQASTSQPMPAAAAPVADKDEGTVTLSPFQVSSAPKRSFFKSNSRTASTFGTDSKVGSIKSSTTAHQTFGDDRASSSKGLAGSAETAVNQPAAQAANTEAYASVRDNEFLGAAANPLSTFSIDVDSASYSNLRRFIEDEELPPPDAVRIEELVNYFPYRYKTPKDDTPFAASLEVAEAPWAPTHRLVRIGLKGREIAQNQRPAANLVFLLDVSGSMDEPNKLPLVKESMRLLVQRLRPDDRVAIVVYAGASGLALPSTPVSKSRDILKALDDLTPGGSTNGAMGIQLAYDVAKANFVRGGVNRVILCTDGDFNVGVTNDGDLMRLITEKAKSGVFLTALGFGMGNLKDSTLEQLADKGNGNYGYIDSRREAEKLLGEQVNGTLVTIAKDVKIQVEFNPAQVASYRLIGYENRLLSKEDFNNDKIDAGEIGAGHTVTALYEVVPVGEENDPAAKVPAVDELKYRISDSGNRKADSATNRVSAIRNPQSDELLTVKIRYKQPDGDVSRKLEFPLTDIGTRFAVASADFKFAAAVAEFGMMLRNSPHRGDATINDVLTWADEGTEEDTGGYRREFASLVRQAAKLMK